MEAMEEKPKFKIPPNFRKGVVLVRFKKKKKSEQRQFQLWALTSRAAR